MKMKTKDTYTKLKLRIKDGRNCIMILFFLKRFGKEKLKLSNRYKKYGWKYNKIL